MAINNPYFITETSILLTSPVLSKINFEVFSPRVKSFNSSTRLSVKNILLKSPIIADMVKNGDIGIVGGIHDITTGEVKFFE